MAGKIKGTVKWFNSSKGFGFISPDDGQQPDVFVHQTGIVARGYRNLMAGEEVEYDIETTQEGRRKAVNVTGPGGAPVKANCTPDVAAGMGRWSHQQDRAQHAQQPWGYGQGPAPYVAQGHGYYYGGGPGGVPGEYPGGYPGGYPGYNQPGYPQYGYPVGQPPLQGTLVYPHAGMMGGVVYPVGRGRSTLRGRGRGNR